MQIEHNAYTPLESEDIDLKEEERPEKKESHLKVDELKSRIPSPVLVSEPLLKDSGLKKSTSSPERLSHQPRQLSDEISAAEIEELSEILNSNDD